MTLTESNETQANIAYIRTHVDNLERMLRFQIGANPESRDAVAALLKGRERAAELYLLLSGEPKTQDQLTAVMKTSQPTVSRILKHLVDAGIVRKVEGAYAWSEFEQLVGVSKIARQLVREASSTTARQARGSAQTVRDSGPIPAVGTHDEGESAK